MGKKYTYWVMYAEDQKKDLIQPVNIFDNKEQAQQYINNHRHSNQLIIILQEE